MKLAFVNLRYWLYVQVAVNVSYMGPVYWSKKKEGRETAVMFQVTFTTVRITYCNSCPFVYFVVLIVVRTSVMSVGLGFVCAFVI